MGDDLRRLRGELPVRFPDFDLPMIDQGDGTSIHWGYGAIARVKAPQGVHGCCGKRVRKGDGWLIFQDGSIACADCARKWYESQRGDL